ncbi:DNA replication/repair protein RecF [Marinimicrobium sp. ABcell2]|uniref:DNA replication/repair protein RecF n=1 Tax=Marinimicrobium sp. ABcell2 TaxID=3069751 RepID=UPI0027B7BEB5|nr:DNA replication/repair protein RecF [Marinimicrobium sp. ABcell2]MDQ2077042.1 DNA replication/repair protein RecF [Marinimicrobium sp. ABcell2]
MTLKRLSIQNLRNLQAVDLEPSPRINLLYGENGSGKTSVLEAIHSLALGRSFRSHKHKPLIRHGQEAFTVFGRVSSRGADIPLGVHRQKDGQSSFKANGIQVSSIAELASYLPVQVINSDSFQLLEGSPKVRRQFIDWLVFHVEPQFFGVWKGAQRCLKHRNALLRRDRIDRSELAVWDRELLTLSEALHQYRSQSVAQFRAVFLELLESFVRIPGVELNYFRGWDRERSYEEVLKANFEKDFQQGYTHSGCHRADLRITVNGQPAGEVLSRGQQKLVVCALKVSQAYVFANTTGNRCVYLVDDLPAELDQHHRARLVDWLEKLGGQVFITGVEREALLADWLDRPHLARKVFHVEQGELKAVDETSSAANE